MSRSGQTIILMVLVGSVAACGSDAPATPATPTPAPRPIQTIVQVMGATIYTGPVAVAQSVTVTNGPFNNLRFAWQLPPVGIPAIGNLYILTQEYLGKMSGLGTSTPGFLARSTRLGSGEYEFDSGVTLPNGIYWFVSDSEIPIFSSRGDIDVYDGGQLYTAGQVQFDGFFQRFWVRSTSDAIDANFTLRGSASTP